MAKKAKKISNKWIEQNREFFRHFLDETDFPNPERIGERGPKFQYPEWLIMFIAVLAVKMKSECSNRLKAVASNLSRLEVGLGQSIVKSSSRSRS